MGLGGQRRGAGCRLSRARGIPDGSRCALQLRALTLPGQSSNTRSSLPPEYQGAQDNAYLHLLQQL